MRHSGLMLSRVLGMPPGRQRHTSYGIQRVKVAIDMAWWRIQGREVGGRARSPQPWWQSENDREALVLKMSRNDCQESTGWPESIHGRCILDLCETDTEVEAGSVAPKPSPAGWFIPDSIRLHAIGNLGNLGWT